MCERPMYIGVYGCLHVCMYGWIRGFMWPSVPLAKQRWSHLFRNSRRLDNSRKKARPVGVYTSHSSSPLLIHCGDPWMPILPAMGSITVFGLDVFLLESKNKTFRPTCILAYYLLVFSPITNGDYIQKFWNCLDTHKNCQFGVIENPGLGGVIRWFWFECYLDWILHSRMIQKM